MGSGHPQQPFVVNMKSGSRAHPTFQIRVPMDDTHTMYFYYTCYLPRLGAEIPPTETVPWYDVPGYTLNERGEPQWSLLDCDSGQDISMWYTQGEVTDRTQEHLGLSDKGVIVYRQMLEANIEKVERGEDPINVFRDPADNMCLELDVEEDKTMQGPYRPGAGPRRGNASKYSPILTAFEEEAAKATAAMGSTGARA